MPLIQPTKEPNLNLFMFSNLTPLKSHYLHQWGSLDNRKLLRLC